MNKIFAPAIGLMDRLRYPLKFGLIFFIVFIPMAGLSINLIASLNDRVTTLENKRLGLSYIKALRQPIADIQKHRSMMAAYLGGDTAFHDRIIQKRATIDKEITELQQLDNVLGTQFNTGQAVRQLVQQWQQIKDQSFQLNTAEAIKIHTALIADMLKLTHQAADASEINLDQHMDSAHIARALISGLPRMLENMGQARALVTGIAAQGGVVNPENHSQLAVLSHSIDVYFKDVSSSLQSAYDSNADIKNALRNPIISNNNAVNEMQARLSGQWLNAQKITLSAEQAFNTATQEIDGSYKLYDALLPMLDQLLIKRIAANHTTMTITLTVTLAILSLIAYLFAGFYFSLRQSIAQISQVADKLANGDMTTRVEITSHDEMAQIGGAINSIAKGVGKTVATLTITSDQFVNVATRLAGSSQTTGNAVKCQVVDIEETARAVSQMAEAVQDVASNTAQAAVSAQQANDTSLNGQKIVSTAVDSIAQLADDLDTVASTIHKLEEQSQNISSILEVICSIADQTNLLALNAAIEAARAGEQGRGFAVVADEVRNLAQRTQNSTLEIQTVIEQLQSGTQEAVKVMEASGAQISHSVEHASSAGKVLQELTGLVAGINEMNARIATSAEQQSAMANEISNSINNMSSASEQSATVAQNSVEDSAQAMTLASEAHSILKRFHVDPTATDESDKHILFQWDASFSVGIKEIDRQHKILVQLVNELYHEVKSNSSTALLGRILQGLIDYTASHFSYEEGLMERYDYADLVAHKAQHKKLVGQVISFQQRVEKHDQGVVEELLVFLKDWLAKHIKGSDAQYAADLNSKGVF